MDTAGRHRRWLINRRQLLAATGISAVAGCAVGSEPQGIPQPLFGFNNGLKIGAVTADSAIVWTRLSRNLITVEQSHPLWYPPTVGTVHLVLWPRGRLDEHRMRQQRATLGRDGTVQFHFTGLEPGTEYNVALWGDPATGDETDELTGSFTTAPDDGTPASISGAVVSCQAWRFRDAGSEGFLTYRTLSDLAPDFFVHTGDMVYYDQGNLRGTTVPTARTHWHRTYSLDYLKAFHNRTPSYFLKDDHDIIDDDCWPGQRYGNLSFEDGVAIFNEQNPVGEVPYRTVRWGTDLQIWLLEMREFRSPNVIPDGPEKTILGNEQIRWLKDTIDRSDAAFRLVISPSIFVGPDRSNKNDNYANTGFATEGSELREFLAERDIVVVGGDRHWQYVSVHEETGLWEFGCGPLARGREGGWRNRDRRPEHRFLAVAPGFAWISVEREDDEPILTIEHRTTGGEIRHGVQFTSDPLTERE